ncbi:hypothetical protein PENARI_c015G07386 [Penicillium arizonense]|uniref:Uncharacterized protein n=1 Tax=Penicillium arizonense TaxID=1835702 RepID=A0A1F5LC47_PENAI|nr:hypothetical protein PENARI_c015G07386 [Penicillium arizonense]OGE50803.1 hypothetical protein PENARI_c015G07386 [Penicillium arizonense]
MSLPLGRPAKNKTRRSRPVSGEQLRGLQSGPINRVVRQGKHGRESRRRRQQSPRVCRDPVPPHRSDSSAEEVTSEVGGSQATGCTEISAVGFFETGDPIGDWILEQECAIARGAGPIDYSGLFHNLTLENRCISNTPTFHTGFKSLCIPRTHFPTQNQGLPAIGPMADASLTIHIVDRGLNFAKVAAPNTQTTAYFPGVLCTTGTFISNDEEAFHPTQDPWRVPGMPPSNIFSSPMDTGSMDQSLSSEESGPESLSEFMAIDTVLPILEMTATSASVSVDGEFHSGRGEVVDLSQSRACLSNLSFVVRRICKVLLSASPSDGQLALAEETDRRLRLIIQLIE